ncbi:hypothetical protein ACEQ8H_001864 [Pleosporales sp. CAS-2024a]
MDFRAPVHAAESDEAILEDPYRPFYNFLGAKPILVKQHNDYDRAVFRETPLLGALLFDNVSSDARDHAANERKKRIGLPTGIVFWILSLLCLGSGLANYVNTVARYSKREAMVQTGWKTQAVFTIVSASIVAACVVFLTTNAEK